MKHTSCYISFLGCCKSHVVLFSTINTCFMLPAVHNCIDMEQYHKVGRQQTLVSYQNIPEQTVKGNVDNCMCAVTTFSSNFDPVAHEFAGALSFIVMSSSCHHTCQAFSVHVVIKHLVLIKAFPFRTYRGFKSLNICGNPIKVLSFHTELLNS